MLGDFSWRRLRVMVHSKGSEKRSRIFVVHFGLQIEALQYNYGKEAPDGCIGKMSFNSLMAASLRFKNTAIQPGRRSYSAMAGRVHAPWRNLHMNPRALFVFALFHRIVQASAARLCSSI